MTVDAPDPTRDQEGVEFIDTGGPHAVETSTSTTGGSTDPTTSTSTATTATTATEDTGSTLTPPAPLQADVFVRRSIPPGCADPTQREDAFLQRMTLPAEVIDEARLDGSAVVVADLFGDHRPAILLGGVNGVSLYRAATRGWEEVSATALAGAHLANVVTGSAVDYDSDGDLDLFLGAEGPNYLLRNDGGMFTDVTVEMGLDIYQWHSASSAWADIDGDRDLDLIVGNYSNGDPPDVLIEQFVDPSELYLNQGDHFEDVSHWLPDHVHEGYVFMAGFFDITGDTLPELFTIHDYGWNQPSSMLMLNVGGTSLLMDHESKFHPDFAGMGLAIGDLNGDGIPDVAQTSYRTLSFLLSEPSDSALTGWQWPFEMALAYGLEIDPSDEVNQMFGWGVEFADVDNDRDLDLPTVFGFWEDFPDRVVDQHDGLWIQDEKGFFTDQAPLWDFNDVGWGRGMVVADLDRDGWLDMVKRELDGPGILYRSNCGEHHWSGIRLEHQSSPNRFGIGSTVDLWSDGERQRRWIHSGSTSMFSGGPAEAHFGLGDVDQIDRVEVTWPDGVVSLVEGLEPDAWVKLIRR